MPEARQGRVPAVGLDGDFQTLPKRSQVKALLTLAGDPTVPREEIQLAEDMWSDGYGAESPDLRGALGFFLFSQSADMLRRGEDCGDPSQYLSDKPSRATLRKCYGLPATLPTEAARLHRVGHTSYILSDEPASGPVAIKLVKPRYLTNNAILASTRRYASEYTAVAAISARVHEPHGERFLVMDFLEGPTLAEHVDVVVATKSLDKPLTATELLACHDLLSAVCEALRCCEEHGIPHGDIGPSNIIVHGRNPTSCRLIDFGLNYLLLERVGAVTDVLQLQVYTAPETLDGKEASLAADLHSMGHLVLYMVSGGKLTTSNATYLHDRLWERHPSLAALVDDLIARDPETRVRFERATKSVGSVYADLKLRLEQEFLRETAVLRLQDATPRRRDLVARALFDPLLTVWALWAQRRLIRSEFLERSRIGYLWWWACACLVAGGVIYFVAWMRVLTDIGIAQRLELGLLTEVLGRANVLRPRGAVADEWPGIMVAVTFAFVAERYYQNLFAMLRVGAVARWAEWSVRAQAFVFAVPILVALLVEPRLWPACSAVGVGMVTVNNWLLLRLVRRAPTGMDEESMPSVTMGIFSTDFSTWYIESAAYTVLLGLGAWFLSAGWLHDERMYAVIVAGMANLIILWRHCVVKRGRLVRMGLCRTVYWIRRRERLKRGLLLGT